MEGDNIILGRDLNLTIKLGEVCGVNARKDPLVEYIYHMFE
jgi:hypothetical protein